MEAADSALSPLAQRRRELWRLRQKQLEGEERSDHKNDTSGADGSGENREGPERPNQRGNTSLEISPRPKGEFTFHEAAAIARFSVAERAKLFDKRSTSQNEGDRMLESNTEVNETQGEFSMNIRNGALDTKFDSNGVYSRKIEDRATRDMQDTTPNQVQRAPIPFPSFAGGASEAIFENKLNSSSLIISVPESSEDDQDSVLTASTTSDFDQEPLDQTEPIATMKKGSQVENACVGVPSHALDATSAPASSPSPVRNYVRHIKSLTSPHEKAEENNGPLNSPTVHDFARFFDKGGAAFVEPSTPKGPSKLVSERAKMFERTGGARRSPGVAPASRRAPYKSDKLEQDNASQNLDSEDNYKETNEGDLTTSRELPSEHFEIMSPERDRVSVDNRGAVTPRSFNMQDDVRDEPLCSKACGPSSSSGKKSVCTRPEGNSMAEPTSSCLETRDGSDTGNSEDFTEDANINTTIARGFDRKPGEGGFVNAPDGDGTTKAKTITESKSSSTHSSATAVTNADVVDGKVDSTAGSSQNSQDLNNQTSEKSRTRGVKTVKSNDSWIKGDVGETSLKQLSGSSHYVSEGTTRVVRQEISVSSEDPVELRGESRPVRPSGSWIKTRSSQKGVSELGANNNVQARNETKVSRSAKSWTKNDGFVDDVENEQETAEKVTSGREGSEHMLKSERQPQKLSAEAWEANMIPGQKNVKEVGHTSERSVQPRSLSLPHSSRAMGTEKKPRDRDQASGRRKSSSSANPDEVRKLKNQVSHLKSELKSAELKYRQNTKRSMAVFASALREIDTLRKQTDSLNQELSEIRKQNELGRLRGNGADEVRTMPEEDEVRTMPEEDEEQAVEIEDIADVTKESELTRKMKPVNETRPVKKEVQLFRSWAPIE